MVSPAILDYGRVRVKLCLQFSAADAFAALNFDVNVLCCLAVGEYKHPSVLDPHFLKSSLVSLVIDV
jgi:hypothetical protein